MFRLIGKMRIFPFFAILLPFPAAAFENLSTTLNEDQQACYSLAMVGMDSVINSRLGVLPEHVVDLASRPQSVLSVNSEPYDHNLLNVILDAYLWKETPHSYAIKVFYKCAQKFGLNKQASIK
jgi:alanine-alpha-ketoisovalerate/valine-pyruvate aminotransferase